MEANLIKNLLVKTLFASYYLKLSPPMFLKCFLILPNFSLMFLIDMFLIKKTCSQEQYVCTCVIKVKVHNR